MKLLLVCLCAALAFSCQKKGERVQNTPEGITPNSKPVGKTLKYNEIILQDVKLKQNLNFGDAESFPVTKKLDDGTEVQQVKLTYIYQENKLIKSKDLDKSKGYCEINVTVEPNKNGSEISYISNQELFRFADFRSERMSKNDLNYEYNATFKLSFQDRAKAKKMEQQIPFSLECFNVMDLADLKSAVDDQFVFTLIKEEK